MNPVLAVLIIIHDPDWIRKTLQASVMSLVPILGQFFLLGWLLETMQSVVQKKENTLPDPIFLDHLSKGFQAWLFILIYTIPLFIFAIPLWVAPILSDSQPALEQFFTLGSLILVAIYGVFMIWMLPAALGKFVTENSLSSAIQFREIIRLTLKAPGTYLIAFVLSLVSLSLSQLGFFFCIVGLGLTNTLAVAFIAQIYGQAYCLSINNKIGSKKGT